MSRPQSRAPSTSRTSSLPSTSRATVTVSRLKNPGPSTSPSATRSRGLTARLARSTLGALDTNLLAMRVAAALVDIQSLVSDLIHRLPVHPWPPGDHADAELHLRRCLGEPVELLERRTNARAYLVGVPLVCVGHSDSELIATETAASVSRAHRPLQLLREHTDRLVADMMAMRVIDLFQVVEVDHHQGEAALVALCGRNGPIDSALELGPVGQAREVVGPSLFVVLPGAVKCNRDLIGDRGDERQVAGLERARQPCRHRHRAQQHSFRAQLCSDRAPLPRDAIDA